MPEAEHKDCYGTMFPSTLEFSSNTPVRGKVFAYQLLTAGSTFRSGRSVTHDHLEWDACVACPEFDHCYKLSLGRLTLETAIGNK